MISNLGGKDRAHSGSFTPASEICLRLAKFFLASALFSVVIVLNGNFYPFMEGKYYFFRLCVESALACTAFSWCFETESGQLGGRLKELARRPLFLAVCAFTGVFLLSSFLAVDPGNAFWSTFERGDGAFQMLHYAAFYVLSLLVLRDQQDWRRMLASSVWATVLVIVFAVASGDVLPLDSQRFAGTLGNSDYAGTYLMFALFFLCALQLLPAKTMLLPESDLGVTKVSGSWPLKAMRSRIGAVTNISLAFSFLLFFIFANARGAFLGLSCAAACAVCYLFFRRPAWRRPLLATAVSISVAYCAAYCSINRPGVKAFPGSRIFLVSLTDASAKERLRSWHAAWQGFLERPVLGWGPENFSAVFDRHFDTAQFQPNNDFCQTWQDRPHNVYLGYLVETGLIGLICFLSIFATLACALKGALAQTRTDVPLSHQNILFQASVIAILVAYLVQGLFLFDVLSSYISLFLTLAFLTWQLYPPLKDPARAGLEERHTDKRILIAGAMAVALAATACYGTCLPMAKSYAYVSMLGDLDSIRTWQGFTATVKKPLDMFSPFGQAELVQDFGWLLAIPIAQTTNQDARILPGLMEMIDSYERPFLADKHNAFLCEHLYLMGALNKAAFEGSGKSKYLDAAQKYFQEGLSFSPNRPEFLYGLYDVYNLRGDALKEATQARLITSIWPDGLSGSESEIRPAHR